MAVNLVDIRLKTLAWHEQAISRFPLEGVPYQRGLHAKSARAEVVTCLKTMAGWEGDLLRPMAQLRGLCLNAVPWSQELQEEKLIYWP